MTRDDLDRARKVLGPTTDAYESPAEHLRDAMELLRKENARLTRERDEAREKANQWEQSCLDCRRHDIERHLKHILAVPSGEQLHVAIQAAREFLEGKP